MVDWSHRGQYIVDKHGVLPAEADEALADLDAVVIDPDYNSKSGRGVRTIGMSPIFGDILTVITLENDGVVIGVNAWRANDRDRRYYQTKEVPDG